MGFRQVRVDLQSAQRRGSRLGRVFDLGNTAIARNQSVRVSQARVSTREGIVFFGSLLEIADCFLESRNGPLVPEIEPFQIEVVSLQRLRTERRPLNGGRGDVMAEGAL